MGCEQQTGVKAVSKQLLCKCGTFSTHATGQKQDQDKQNKRLAKCLGLGNGKGIEECGH